MIPTDKPRGGILQRDKKTYAIVARAPVGLVTPDALERIARVARKHAIPLLKITSGQRIALVGLAPDEVEEVWAELGMDVGPAAEVCVHYVQACPGTTWCKYGKQDSIGLGIELERQLVGVEMPAKVKLGVSGCPLNCAESYVRDVGIFGRKNGWTLVFGGNAGAKPRIADELARDLSTEDAISLTHRCLDYFVANAKRKERASRFVERIGLDALRESVL